MLLLDVKSNRRKKPGQDASHFKKDGETGKMIIDENSDSDAVEEEAAAARDVAGGAYQEAITSVDGFTRTPSGKVKFNKDTKKRRREEEAMDVDLDVHEASSGKTKKTKKREEFKFGHEFKAKVCFFSNWLPIVYSVFMFSLSRKLEVMSRRVGRILMLTCPLPKQRRLDVAVVKLVLQANDSSYLYKGKSITNVCVRCH